MTTMILGCGYVGRACLNHWLGKRYLIATTTTEGKELPADEVHVVRGDQEEKLRPLLEKSDYLIISVAPKDKSLYEETYLNTAKTVQKIGAPLKQLIYLSSTSVYGDRNGEWVDEKTPLAPATHNGLILKETEEIYTAMPNTTILRLGGIFGPGRHLSQKQGNLVHLNDIIRAIDWAQEKNLNGLYNLVSDRYISSTASKKVSSDKLKKTGFRFNDL